MSAADSKKYAVIELGGRQHLVWPGVRLTSNRLADKEGELVIKENLLDRSPVKVKIISHGVAKKVRGLKFRAKTRYMRRFGHRQLQSIVEVVSIGDEKKVSAEENKKTATVLGKSTKTKKTAKKATKK